MKKSETSLSLAPRALIGVIRLYQKTLSPDHGLISPFFPNGVCRFPTTCSEYTIQKIAEKGVILGVLSGMVRILSCNPFFSPKSLRQF